MFTVRDVNTGEFLFWIPESECFIFSRSRWTVKDDYGTIMQFLQHATEGYTESVSGRTLGIYEVRVAADPTAVYNI